MTNSVCGHSLSGQTDWPTFRLTAILFWLSSTTRMTAVTQATGKATLSRVASRREIQDAFATPGASPALSVELTALDVIGFDRVSSQVPVSVTSLTPSVALPATLGTPITWTATTSGGTPPLQYQFWRFTDGSGWSVAQAVQLEQFLYMVSTCWHACAGGVGQEQRIYRGAVRCWALHRLFQCRRADGDAERPAIGCRVSGAVQGADHVHRYGDRERRGGGIQVREVFGFDRLGGGPGLLLEQRLFVYPPLGTNVVQVWVRAVGSTAVYQDYLSTDLFNVVEPAPRISAVQANVAFPAASTSTITWTVLASGGAGPLDTKFHRFDQATGTWTVLRDWSQNNQASWTPGTEGVGVHWLQVWVRTVGSSATYDDWRSTDSFLVTPTEVSLTSNRALTGLHLNDVVTWTAAVAGAPGPWEFKFVAYDSTAWRVLQDYSPQTTFTWFPPASTCALQVWVRRIGSNAAWELYQSTGLFVVSP